MSASVSNIPVAYEVHADSSEYVDEKFTFVYFSTNVMRGKYPLQKSDVYVLAFNISKSYLKQSTKDGTFLTTLSTAIKSYNHTATTTLSVNSMSKAFLMDMKLTRSGKLLMTSKRRNVHEELALVVAGICFGVFMVGVISFITCKRHLANSMSEAVAKKKVDDEASSHKLLQDFEMSSASLKSSPSLEQQPNSLHTLIPQLSP